MRRERIFLKLGVLIFLVLAGACLFLVPVTSEVAVVAVEAPIEAVAAVGAFGLEALPLVLLGGIALAVVLRFVSRARQGSQQEKRKHDDEVAPYLGELIEQGVVRLEDDGELPELTGDDLYTGDKPKRSEEDD